MQTFFNFLDYISRATTLVVVVAFLYGLVLWARGIAPVLVRLGKGLARRKIAVFAKGDMLKSLESLLDDSKLIRRTNVVTISHTGDISKAECASLFLVVWSDWKDDLPRILSLKKDQTPLIIYAPQDLGSIPPEVLRDLNSHRNCVVSNFRGRLMNDVVVSMITTSYEKA